MVVLLSELHGERRSRLCYVDAFDDLAGAREQMEDQLEHASTYAPAEQIALARTRLDDWISTHIEPNELVGKTNKHGEREGAYKIDIPDDVRWAFISWEV